MLCNGVIELAIKLRVGSGGMYRECIGNGYLRCCVVK